MQDCEHVGETSREFAPHRRDGRVIFVALFVEGLTLPRIHQLIVLHVFRSMLLVGSRGREGRSTTYRFARYYRGQRDYVQKGPPPLILRVLGPFVTV